MPQQAQSEGERDRHPAVRTRVEKRQKRKMKDKDEDERPKHHAVRANKYGQAGLEPRHSDITPCQPRRHVLEAGEKKWQRKKKGENKEG